VVEEGPAAAVLTRPRSAFAARIAGLDALRGTWRLQPDGSGAVVDAAGRAVVGTPEGTAPADGAAAVAVWRPSAVAVHPGGVPSPAGSPRTVLDVVVTELEPLGDRVRVRAGDLAADVTAAAVADLGLAPGAAVRFAVKATEVAVHPV
jgi:molybdate transport system ATP-binding protein